MKDSTAALLGLGGLGLGILALGSKPKRARKRSTKGAEQTRLAVGERVPASFNMQVAAICAGAHLNAANEQQLLRDVIAPSWAALAPHHGVDARLAGRLITAVAEQIAKRCPPPLRLRAVATVKRIAESAWRDGYLR